MLAAGAAGVGWVVLRVLTLACHDVRDLDDPRKARAGFRLAHGPIAVLRLVRASKFASVETPMPMCFKWCSLHEAISLR